MRFAPDVEWRVSKRGLVLSDPRGDTMLLEHPHAATLPERLSTDPSPEEVAAHFCEDSGATLVAEMLEAGLLTDDDAPPSRRAPDQRPRRVQLTRSGLEVAGIGTLACWFNTHLMPTLLSTWFRIVVLAVLAGGVVAFAVGPPSGPRVSANPAADAVLGFVVVLACSFAHEFAHAVALSRYGRRARRAGFGFYWGGICFYVDATDGVTLPRRERVIQALAGLGVDIVTVSLLAITAHATDSVLITAVAWRVAVLGVLDIVTNALPILEVDGHVALADYLDEPDLAPRARRALGEMLRHRRLPERDTWMALYGAVSLLGGVTLLVLSAWVFWHAAGDLVLALAAGSRLELLLLVPVVGPVLAGTLLSLLGLILETVMPARTDHDESQ